MGEVYAAFDEKLERDVALKVLVEEGDAALQKKRLLREARLAAKLQHPNIATVYEVDELEGRLYIVMELLEGSSLRKILNQRKVSREEAVSIARDIARALAKAHSAGVTHRDIKPENVFVTMPSPDAILAKVLDFGLARQRPKVQGDEERTSTDTATRGDMWGTPGYVSPEQAHGQPVDARTDIFSFGVVFYEMLANIRPFRGENAIAMMLATTRQEPRPLREILPDLPHEIDDIVRRCLAKRADDRYADGGELNAALEQYVRGTAKVVNVVGSSPSLPLISFEEPVADVNPTVPSDDAPTTGSAALALTTREDPVVPMQERGREHLVLLAAIGSGLGLALIILVIALSWSSSRRSAAAASASASASAGEPPRVAAPEVQDPPDTAPEELASPEPPTPAPEPDPAPELDPIPETIELPSSPVTAAQQPLPAASATKKKKPADDCAQPFVVDAKGVRIPKIHCLK